MEFSKSKLVVVVLIVILSVSTYANAAQSSLKIEQTIQDREEYITGDISRFQLEKKPTVALALTGGGAKAFFNVGVIKALEEENIPIDIIVGTSMGSIVGAMYGSGLSIEQIEELMIATPFAQLLDLNFINANSILETAKVNKFIENIVPQKRLEDFVIPTALLSLEINSGQKHLFTTGKISELIQGSYAIPHLFPIHQQEESYFVDPGIVESSPAKAATALGADFVIATNVFNIDTSNYDNSEKILNRYLEIVDQRNADRILANYADLVISSDVKDYSFMDFSSVEQLIAIGYRDTKHQMDQLKGKLAQRKIGLAQKTDREKLDLSQQLNDIKYDRIIIDTMSLDPLIHYGQDYSFFKQDLLKSRLHDFQSGFQVDRGHFNFELLAVDNTKENLEAKLRWKKLTPKLDLITKFKQQATGNNNAELALKYYAADYNLGLGLGTIGTNKYFIMDNKYQASFHNFDLAGEIDLVVDQLDQAPEILISQQATTKLSNSLSLEPKVVVSNTDLQDAPIIYRGRSIATSSPKFQLAVDYAYTYQFSQPVQVSEMVQFKDMGVYLFTDYLKHDSQSLAYGGGFASNLYLLGLKPFEVESYLVYEEKTEDTELRFNLNYNF
jgi:NTE family protein